MDSDLRYSRQEKNVMLDTFKNEPISIIGVGAVGREIALKLTQMGAENLTLVDFDKVEEPNICTQGYTEDVIGQLKVDATRDACLRINSKANISAVNKYFKEDDELSDIVFCCVDKMSGRDTIWKIAKPTVKLFIDTRMAAEVCRVITIFNNIDKLYYPTTLFSDEDGYQAGCTTQATCFCASIVAGIAVANFAKWSRDAEIVIKRDITYNIFTNQLFSEGEE